MDSKIIDGIGLSRQVKSEVSDSVKRLKMEIGRSPGLSVVLVGDDPDKWNRMITNVLGDDFPYFAVIGEHDGESWLLVYTV